MNNRYLILSAFVICFLSLGSNVALGSSCSASCNERAFRCSGSCTIEIGDCGGVACWSTGCTAECRPLRCKDGNLEAIQVTCREIRPDPVPRSERPSALGICSEVPERTEWAVMTYLQRDLISQDASRIQVLNASSPQAAQCAVNSALELARDRAQNDRKENVEMDLDVVYNRLFVHLGKEGRPANGVAMKFRSRDFPVQARGRQRYYFRVEVAPDGKITKVQKLYSTDRKLDRHFEEFLKGKVTVTNPERHRLVIYGFIGANRVRVTGWGLAGALYL